MRTKATILTAAVLAAGVASSMAQSNVYSLNVVGYVNVTVNPGYNAICNPLDDGAGDSLTNIIGGSDATAMSLPDGTGLLPWAGSTYGAGQTYYQGFGWYDANLGSYSTNKLAPGKGFFIFSPGPTTNITFVGTVLQGTNNFALGAGYTLTGSAFPAALPPGVAGDGLVGTTMQIPVSDGDGLTTYSNPGGYYGYTYYAGYGWYDPNNGNLSTNGPSLAVASSFFLFKSVPSTWTQTFTVH